MLVSATVVATMTLVSLRILGLGDAEGDHALPFAVRVCIVFFTIEGTRMFLIVLIGAAPYSPVRHAQTTSFRPLVSVVIPAWNEQVGVAKTIASVLESDYSELEVVVVNDGSTDKTQAIVEAIVRRFPDRVSLVNQANGGKGAALNNGVRLSRGEIIVNVDADSAVDKAAIGNMVRCFSDPDVLGVVGRIVVGNTSRLLSRVQAFEYMFGFHLNRLRSRANTIFILSGAMNAYRRSAYDQTEGFRDYSKTEDMDFSLQLRGRRGRLAYAADAICVTEGAGDFRGLLHQRTRWKYGAFACFSRHRRLFLSARRTPALSLYELPFALVGTVQTALYPLIVAFAVSLPIITGDHVYLGLMCVAVPVNFTLVFLSQGSIRRHARYLPAVTVLMVIAMAVECLSTWAALVQHARRKNVAWTSWQRQGLDEASAAIPALVSGDSVSGSGHSSEPWSATPSTTGYRAGGAVAPPDELATGDIHGAPAAPRVMSDLIDARTAGPAWSLLRPGRHDRVIGLPLRLGSLQGLLVVSRIVWHAVTKDHLQHGLSLGQGLRFKWIHSMSRPIGARRARFLAATAGIRVASSPVGLDRPTSPARPARALTAAIQSSLAPVLSALAAPRVARATLRSSGVRWSLSRVGSTFAGSLQGARRVGRLAWPDAGHGQPHGSPKRMPLLRARTAKLRPALRVEFLPRIITSVRDAINGSSSWSLRERTRDRRMMTTWRRGQPTVPIAGVLDATSHRLVAGSEAFRSWGRALGRRQTGASSHVSADHGGSHALRASRVLPGSEVMLPGSTSKRQHPERTLGIPIVGGEPPVYRLRPSLEDAEGRVSASGRPTRCCENALAADLEDAPPARTRGVYHDDCARPSTAPGRRVGLPR